MRKLILAATLCAGVAACGSNESSTANDSAATGESTGQAVNAGTTTTTTQTASAAFPRGARIVEENGVTYRIDADGTRVQLGPNESRIVVENGTRFRVDPDGTRVRIDPQGATIDVDLPDVDVGINAKGHPDVDVRPPDVNVNRH